MKHNDVHYDPEEIEEHCNSAVEDVEISEPVDVSEYDGDFKLRKDANPPAEKWDELTRLIPKAQSKWNHDDDQEDQSPSGYDLGLANYAASMGWTDQEIVDLLIAHRRKHNANLNLDRPDYFKRTIQKARQQSEDTKTSIKVDAILEDEDDKLEIDEEETKEDKLKVLSELLKTPVTRVIKYTTETPTYAIESNGERIDIGEIDQIESQTKFRRNMLNLCGVVVKNPNTGKPFDKETWFNIVQRFIECAEVEELGEESTAYGKIDTWVRSHVDQYALPSPEEVRSEEVGDWYNWKQKASNGEPFVRSDGWWLNLASLRKHIQQSFSDYLGQGELAKYLKRYDATKQRIQCKHNGDRIDRHYWKLPEGESY